MIREQRVAMSYGRPARLSLRARLAVEGYALIAPWLVGYVLWVAGPMVFSFVLMFMKWDILTPPAFFGLGNFSTLIHDNQFYIALGNQIFYTVISVPVYLIFSLGLALLLNWSVPGIGLFRVLYYVPSQVPAVATAFLWSWIFNPQFGLANAILGLVHLPPQQWLFDPALAKPCLIIMGLWGIGSSALIFLAGLQGVPQHLLEAAALDGSGLWHRFWRIIFPMLSPVVLFNLILGIIGAFQAGFTIVYIWTQNGGGPSNSLLMYPLYIYNQAWTLFHMGYASVLSWVLFLIVAALTALNFGLSRRWVYYESGS